MAKLDHRQQAFIVTRIARFEPPRAIAVAFEALFSTKLDQKEITKLDPQQGAVISPDLFDLFKVEREKVLLDPTSAPFAEQKARLVALSSDVLFYRNNNELASAAMTIRQIAEELGVVGSGAKAKAAGNSAEETKEILSAITRTIVDPKQEKSS